MVSVNFTLFKCYINVVKYTLKIYIHRMEKLLCILIVLIPFSIENMFCIPECHMIILVYLAQYKYNKIRFKYLPPIGRNVPENFCVSQ